MDQNHNQTREQGNYFRFNLSPNLTLGLLLLLLLHLHAARVTPQRVTVVGSRSSEKCGRPLVLDNYCICISLCNCKLLCFLAFAQKQLIIPKTARSTAERTDSYSACCLDHRRLLAGWVILVTELHEMTISAAGRAGPPQTQHTTGRFLDGWSGKRQILTLLRVTTHSLALQDPSRASSSPPLLLRWSWSVTPESGTGEFRGLNYELKRVNDLSDFGKRNIVQKSRACRPLREPPTRKNSSGQDGDTGQIN